MLLAAFQTAEDDVVQVSDQLSDVQFSGNIGFKISSAADNQFSLAAGTEFSNLLSSPSLDAGAELSSHSLAAGVQFSCPSLAAGVQFSSPSLAAGAQFSGVSNHVEFSGASSAVWSLVPAVGRGEPGANNKNSGTPSSNSYTVMLKFKISIGFDFLTHPFC